MEEPTNWIGQSRGGSSYSFQMDKSIKVELSVDVHDIVSVDCQNERFDAVWVIFMQWMDPTLRDFISQIQFLDEDNNTWEVDGIIRKRKNDAVVLEVEGEAEECQIQPWCIMRENQPDWSIHFFPKHSYINRISVQESLLEESLKLHECTEYGGVVRYKAKFLSTFQETMELNDFPFDQQLLRIRITAEMSVERFRFAPLFEAGGTAHQCLAPEWSFDTEMQKLCTMYVHAIHSKMSRDKQFSNAEVLLHLKRDEGFYNSNVYLPIFSLVTASLVSYRVQLENIQDRASIQAAFLLIMVSFKHMVAQWIPRKKYTTRMDRYIIKAFYLNFVMIAQGVVLHIICFGMEPLHLAQTDENNECPLIAKFDNCCLACLAMIWIVGHVLSYGWHKCKRRCGCCLAGHAKKWKGVYLKKRMQSRRLPKKLLDELGLPHPEETEPLRCDHQKQSPHKIGAARLVARPWSVNDRPVRRQNFEKLHKRVKYALSEQHVLLRKPILRKAIPMTISTS